MKQFCSVITHFCRPSAFYRHWYLPAILAIISLSAFHTGEFHTGDNQVSHEPLMYKLPDSLTAIDHQFTEQLLQEYRTKKVADSLVTYARKFQGKPYHWGGKSPKGFDCSGFVAYVYNAFGIKLQGSSQHQSQHGQEIPLEKVQKGDVLFFTGSNPNYRRVGHVGIVISDPDEDIRFVHSSTNSGVIVSELKGYYETRLLAAKRMLGEEEAAKDLQAMLN